MKKILSVLILVLGFYVCVIASNFMDREVMHNFIFYAYSFLENPEAVIMQVAYQAFIIPTVLFVFLFWVPWLTYRQLKINSVRRLGWLFAMEFIAFGLILINPISIIKVMHYLSPSSITVGSLEVWAHLMCVLATLLIMVIIVNRWLARRA